MKPKEQMPNQKIIERKGPGTIPTVLSTSSTTKKAPVQQTVTQTQQIMNPIQQTMTPIQQAINPMQQAINPMQQTMAQMQQTMATMQPPMDPMQQMMAPVGQIWQENMGIPQQIQNVQIMGANNSNFGQMGPASPAPAYFQIMPMQNPFSLDPYGYNYPKGIPRSFYNGQTGNFITLNMQEPENYVNMVPQPQIMQPESMQPKNIDSMYEVPKTESLVLKDQVQTTPIPQQYSPSQIYTSHDSINDEDLQEDPNSPIKSEPEPKRLSAFKRLGPITQPKKPKLTINLMVNNEQSVREVVDVSGEKDNKYTPAHKRQDVLVSTDPTVMKFLEVWPWKKKVRCSKRVGERFVPCRPTKKIIIADQDEMMELYEKNTIFKQITVMGYPSTWNKEDVLDAVLDSLKGCQIMPLFIYFTHNECKFLVLRCLHALQTIHKYGFKINKGDVVLHIEIAIVNLGLKVINFVPEIELRERLIMAYDDENSKLDLRRFTLKKDISYFMYFPLNRTSNQAELVMIRYKQLWENLVEIDLSHNRLTSINGFNFPQSTPKLKHLILSHNLIERLTVLLCCKGLYLNTINLEGNPVCSDYRDPEHYVNVIKMMFPTIAVIDGLAVPVKKNLPEPQKNYCPVEAKQVVEKFLEVYFPLWDASYEQRGLMQNLYEENAMVTINFTTQLRYGQMYKMFPVLFERIRSVNRSHTGWLDGSTTIMKFIKSWPELVHDPYTFTVDVLHHSEDSTVLKVGGLFKLTTKSLADEEHLIGFTRTVILRCDDFNEYKIHKEWVVWYEPTKELSKTAFQINMMNSKELSLKLESAPSEELKEKLIEIFMELTTMEKKPSQKCLEINNWHLKNALVHFSKFLKLDNLDFLLMDSNDTKYILPT